MIFTQHGRARCQQRAVRDSVIDVLWDYGEIGHRKGADIIYMSKRGRLLARRDLGRRLFVRLERQLDSYLVVSPEGKLITAGRRRTRLKFQGRSGGRVH